MRENREAERNSNPKPSQEREISKKQRGKGAGAELESLTGCRESRECLVGWIELQELRLGQREGTQGHAELAELSVPSACFWSVLGMPPLGNLPAGGVTELPRPCSCCRVTEAHRHALRKKKDLTEMSHKYVQVTDL